MRIVFSRKFMIFLFVGVLYVCPAAATWSVIVIGPRHMRPVLQAVPAAIRCIEQARSHPVKEPWRRARP